MENVWDILKKELLFYGIELVNNKTCVISVDKKSVKASIDGVISNLHKRLYSNGELFESTWQEVLELFEFSTSTKTREAYDKKMVKLFLFSIKDTFNFAEFICENFGFKDINLKNKIVPYLRDNMDRDFYSFTKQTVLFLPEYKITLDYIFRKMSILAYLIRLLRFAKKGEKKISNLLVKSAAGISGPWANLDLPMAEREYEYQDIDEEMRDRTKAKQHQARYRKAMEHYNTPEVGEGHYWRELNQEPFSWYNRNTDSPYKSRNTLMNWG